MKTLICITAVAASLVTGLGAGAPQAQQPGDGLSRVFEQEASPAVDAWRAQLAERDLAQRERNFDSLIDAARGDPRLRRMLEQWAADTNDLELAWTARLALRELAANPLGWFDSRYSPGGVGRLPLGADGLLEAQRFFEQLEQQWRDLHDAWPQSPGAQAPTPGASGSSSSAESFNLSVGPEGVKCEVRRDVDGSEEVKTYAAASMEELLEANPELRDKLNLRVFGGGAQWGLDAFPSRGWRFRTDPLSTTGQDNLRTDILGVLVLRG
jgi:hypothetical protein